MTESWPIGAQQVTPSDAKKASDFFTPLSFSLGVMKLRTIFFCILTTAASVAVASTDDDGYNEVTIRPSDIPQDAPRFESYPAKLYEGKNAKPNLHSDHETRMFRSRISEWSKEKPNFAGHYILATWGCGTNCTQLAIIDAKTGKVFHPAGVTYNEAANVHHELLEGGDFWHASGAIKFRPDSKLLVLIGMPEEDTTRRGISYYVWNGTKLSLVRFVHKSWYQDHK